MMPEHHGQFITSSKPSSLHCIIAHVTSMQHMPYLKRIFFLIQLEIFHKAQKANLKGRSTAIFTSLLSQKMTHVKSISYPMRWRKGPCPAAKDPLEVQPVLLIPLQDLNITLIMIIINPHPIDFVNCARTYSTAVCTAL